MEELQSRHRKEQRDLQGRITQKKKNATKKTRKGVNDECDRLETELKERHQAEIDELNGNVPVASDLDEKLEDLSLDNSDTSKVTPNGHQGQNQDLDSQHKNVSFDVNTTKAESPASEDQSQQQSRTKKPNRQKARLARIAADREAQAKAAEEEAASLPDLREQELTSMKSQMKTLGLTETYVRPDGHCLYSACALGIPPEAVKAAGPYSQGYQNVRFATADFISKHPSDFEAFLEEPLDSYVKKIKDTAEWGGEMELQAIARSFGVTINVLQADGRIEKIAPVDAGAETDKVVWLAYYRHSFGLGEHYNALSKTDSNVV